MDIDLTGLLVFRHIAETGNFSQTARHFKISQPAVSIMISKLETEAGLVLLERGISGARLTIAGSHFLECVNEVCDAYVSFTDGMRALGRRMDRKTLLAIDSSWFGERLREAIGKTEVPATSSTSLSETGECWWQELESSQCDIVVAGRFLRAGLSPGIQEAVIRRERGITVAWNPDFYPFDPVNFNFPEVLRTTILIPDAQVVTGFANFLLMWSDYAYGIEPANAVTFPSEAEAAAAAAAGLGVLLGPGDAMPRIGAAGEGLVHVRTFEFLLPEAFTLGVYCRSDEDSKEILNIAASIGKLGRKIFSKL
ncbi:MAG: LysR family transcriptional regulator [Verrucomicrobiota bacterium]